jgi:hypothetical protein
MKACRCRPCQHSSGSQSTTQHLGQVGGNDRVARDLRACEEGSGQTDDSDGLVGSKEPVGVHTCRCTACEHNSASRDTT